MVIQSELKKILHYSPETGLFTWAVDRRRIRAGRIAGSINVRGYIQIGIEGKLYYAHRLAFLYQTGVWPDADVDHISGDRSDNSWCNLRKVAHKENMKNISKASNNTSGVTGVCWNSRLGKWMSYITDEEKRRHLGVFESLDEAIKIRKHAEKIHGYHENHGRTDDVRL